MPVHMTYSLIPRSKTGNCSQCGDEDVPCVKVGKELFCAHKCHKNNKTLRQIKKAQDKAALPRQISKLRGEKNFMDNEVMQSRNNLINDLDVVCSRYVRLLYSDNNLNCKCYTCPTTKHWTLMQNGHFVSRKHIGLRFDLKNQRQQCEYCNCHLHGNLEVYREELNKEEKGLADRLMEQSHLVEKPSNDELKQLLIDMRAKLNAIEKTKGIKK